MHEVLRVLAARAHAGRHRVEHDHEAFTPAGGVQVFAIMENAYQGSGP